MRGATMTASNSLYQFSCFHIDSAAVGVSAEFAVPKPKPLYESSSLSENETDTGQNEQRH
jgi:hypothetical protein